VTRTWRPLTGPDVAPAFLPSREQERLLRAALWRGEDALEAWHEWKSQVDIGCVDAGSERLLPLVYRNLGFRESLDPVMEKLRASYLRTWYANQLSFEATAPVVDAFQRAGIRTMFLKGAALTLMYYRDHGVRPMEDVDAMIPAGRVAEAAQLLGDTGWTSQPPRQPSQFTAASQWFIHSWNFRNKGQQQIDLHWHLSPECCSAQADADFWGSAGQCEFKQRRVWTLAPADQLLHVCVHGAEWFLTPSVRWVADAVIILSGADTVIDWNRFVELAARHRLIRPVEQTLGYLHQRMRAPVPAWVLQSLAMRPTSRMERVEFRIRNSLPGPEGTFHSTLRWWRRVWWRHVRNVGLPAAMFGLPRMLQDTWGLEGPRAVLGQAGRRLWRMVRRVRSSPR
jgi:hypothetical protein